MHKASPFIESLLAELRLRGYSLRTEKAYLHWVKRFIHYIGMRHLASAGADEIRAFLTFLATDLHVAIHTQKVVLNALVFMYHMAFAHVLGTHYSGTASPLDRIS